MFTTLLEKNAWVIYKFGMPLVYFYHLLLASVFFNTAAEDAQGLEKFANQALAPMQYLCEGKKAIPLKGGYQLERRFDYENHFFLKTAISTTALPFSVVVGSTLKSLSYLSSETRERSKKIYSAAYSTTVKSNIAYYRSIGLQVEDYTQAEHIAAPKWKRQPGTGSRLAEDVEALKAIIVLLNKHQIPFWLDCGSCLGCYQYGGCIPADWDIDVAVLLPDFQNVKNALQELDKEKYAVQDWSGRTRPESYLKVFLRKTGGMIDIYHFAIEPENKQVHAQFSNEFNIFASTSWKTREKRYTAPMPYSHVFPLKKATFEGIEVPVPGNIEKYLQVFYGENLAPAKVYNELTGNYEKDLTHPYWQIPCAH